MTPRPTSGAMSRPEDRVEEPEEVELGGVLGRRGRVDLGHRGEQRAVHVAPAQERQHVLVEDLLALLVGQELRAIPGPGVELDLAVARVALVEVVQDHEAVVEARAADAPLVHQLDGALLRLLGGLAAGHLLRVDDDLGAGPLLDRRRSSTRRAARPTGRGPRRCRRRPGRPPGPGTAARRRPRSPRRRGRRAIEREPRAARVARARRRRGVGAGRMAERYRRVRARVAATATGWRTRIRRTSSAACS